MKIITWLWKQKTARFEYTTAHVNAWAEAMRTNCTRDVSFACVTDQPDGLLDWIEAIPLPQDFCNVKTKVWGEYKGLPQCYKRLAMFAPNAKEWMGADRWLSMDLDCVVTSNIDHLIDRTEDFLIFRGTSAKRPCNGGFLIMNNGARPQVYTEFNEANAKKASECFVGSDQAWIAYILGSKSKDWRKGWKEKVVGKAEGVEHYSPAFVRLNGGVKFIPPKNLCILFCPGSQKFFADMTFINAPAEMIRNVELCMRKKRVVTKDCFVATQTFRGNSGSEKRRYKKGDELEDWEINDKWLKKGLVRRKTIYINDDLVNCRLLALQDNKGWANLAAKHAGAYIIKDVEEATSIDTVLVRMRCNGKAKQETLKAVKKLTEKGCKTIPSLSEAMFYDDKCRQLEYLQEWMPETKIFTDAKEAEQYATEIYYPIIGKRKNGASSNNVVLLKNKTALRKYIKKYLSKNISVISERYIYLQEYIPTSCDYRINVCGKYVFGKVRLIRSEDEPFASGSGKNYVIDMTTPEQIQAAKMAIEICEKHDINWMCFDFVEKDGQMFVLEMSSAWQHEWYNDCIFFDRKLNEISETEPSCYFEELKWISEKSAN